MRATMVWIWVVALAAVALILWAERVVPQAASSQPPPAVQSAAPRVTDAAARPQIRATPRLIGAPQVSADPSIDPVILRRALSPPRRDLPPEARPQVIANDPPHAVWTQLQEEHDAVPQ